MLINTFSRSVELQSLTDPDVKAVRGLRLWVAAQHAGRCPVAALAAQLGCMRTSAHLHLLLEEVGAAWPDPFAVSPPCCPRLSHDEATFAAMLVLAYSGNRLGFDRHLADLIGPDERERLFHSAALLGTYLRAPSVGPVTGC